MNIAFFGYANYQVNGLQKPKIEVPSDNVTVTESEGAFDIWNGVKATNSIGYDEDLDYVIKNANGDEVTIEDANVTPGVYTIEYSFIAEPGFPDGPFPCIEACDETQFVQRQISGNLV